MRRPISLETEVARRIDDAVAEVLLPDAIDDHAGGEGGASVTIASARSIRPLPVVSGRGIPGESTSKKRRGATVAFVGGNAANLNANVLRLAGRVIEFGMMIAAGKNMQCGIIDGGTHRLVNSGLSLFRRAIFSRISAIRSAGVGRVAGAVGLVDARDEKVAADGFPGAVLGLAAPWRI